MVKKAAKAAAPVQQVQTASKVDQLFASRLKTRTVELTPEQARQARKEEPTEAQARLMVKWGCKQSEIDQMTKYDASEWIDAKKVQLSQPGTLTAKQLDALVACRFTEAEVADLSYFEAIDLMDRIFKDKPRRNPT